MSIKLFDNDRWLVQVQSGGRRKTKRGSGGEGEAKRVELELAGELAHELKLDEAARTLGVDRASAGEAAKPPPTLREFFVQRWAEHARVVQNEQTRRTSQTPFRYLLYYLGDKPLSDLLRPTEINAFVEAMKRNGPVSFMLRKDGQPRRRKCEELTNATINKALQCLQALLNLAHAEEVISTASRIDMLPTDDSTPVLPPTEEQFRHLLKTCESFREVAPLMPEVVEFVAETGLRRAEVFHLTWASVDLERGAIRVEMQTKGRMVNGRAWRPKHNKWREVPLSAKAKAIVEQRRADGPSGPNDLVFPNSGGAPYDRMDRAPEAAGKGYFFDAVEAAGLKGRVTFHGLRHLFAVRLLTRGVPITVVSELLGHSDVNLTVKRYGRYASDAKVKWDAVKVLDFHSD